MRLAFAAVACLIAAVPPGTSVAQVYQWKDSNGKTVISDTPPPANAKAGRTIGTAPPPSTSASATDSAASKTTAEKDMDFKKRQQAAKEKADKEAKEQAAAAARKDTCERAKRQVATLESGIRIATYDEQGKQRVMDDAERQQEMERARKLVADTCN